MGYRTATVTILQHVECETAGAIEDILRSSGISFHYIRPFRNEPIPNNAEGIDGLVIMGGPMGVYETDRHPFLIEEIRFIQQVLSMKIPILGVCLGSQLLAAALEAAVRPSGFKEIGWHEVTLLADARDDALFAGIPNRFIPLHWHGDVCELPAGAVALARSSLAEVQAFRAEAFAYGLLFHLEATVATLTAMATTFEHELSELGMDQGEFLSQSGVRLKEIATIGEAVFSRWAALIKSSE